MQAEQIQFVCVCVCNVHIIQIQTNMSAYMRPNTYQNVECYVAYWHKSKPHTRSIECIKMKVFNLKSETQLIKISLLPKRGERKTHTHANIVRFSLVAPENILKKGQ